MYSELVISLFFALALCQIFSVQAFMPHRITWLRNSVKVQMADVELTFPNGKKAKVPAGSAMKDAAKKAGFSPNYGCEEGKLFMSSWVDSILIGNDISHHGLILS